MTITPVEVVGFVYTGTKRFQLGIIGITDSSSGCDLGAFLIEPWLSADDIAVHLGVTKDTIYIWIAEKGMPAHKIGRLWKFQASEVDDWVRGGGAAGNVLDGAKG